MCAAAQQHVAQLVRNGMTHEGGRTDAMVGRQVPDTVIEHGKSHAGPGEWLGNKGVRRDGGEGSVVSVASGDDGLAAANRISIPALRKIAAGCPLSAIEAVVLDSERRYRRYRCERSEPAWHRRYVHSRSQDQTSQTV